MRRRSFFAGLFLGNLWLALLVVTLTAAISYQFLNQHYRRQQEADQARLASMARQYFQDRWPLPPGQIDQACRTLLGLGGNVASRPGAGENASWEIRLTVIAADGKVLGDSAADASQLVNHKTPDRHEIIAALEGREGVDVRSSGTLRMPYRYVGLPIVHEGRVVGVARLSMPVRAFAENTTFLRDSLLWSALAGAVAAALGCLLTSWLWYAPVKRLSAAARRMAAGDLQGKALVSGPNEQAELAKSLNRIRETLASQMAEVNFQREQLLTVVENLAEGVIAVDADGRIALINPVAISLLNVTKSPAVGQHVLTVVRSAPIADLVGQVLASGQPVRSQVEWEADRVRKTLEVHAQPVPGQRPQSVQVLLTVRDRTAEIRTAAVKAEFVTNASHELRTPVATLRAAIDSLRFGGQEKETFDKCLDVLDRHSARLEDLIADLLDLHMAERPQTQANVDEMTCGEVVDWVGAQFQDLAAEKGLQLKAESSAPEAEFGSDRVLVQMILRNLVENAIKFTDAGTVGCAIEKGADGKVTLRVSDTGRGIRPEDQTRVFERFYQVDRSRSGDARTRGTGLGLAIVKHAAERLGGKVELQSRLGVGTLVTVTLG